MYREYFLCYDQIMIKQRIIICDENTMLIWLEECITLTDQVLQDNHSLSTFENEIKIWNLKLLNCVLFSFAGILVTYFFMHLPSNQIIVSLTIFSSKLHYDVNQTNVVLFLFCHNWYKQQVKNKTNFQNILNFKFFVNDT